ncbi:MAG TPA: cytochrome C biogenesis protein CcmH [Rhodocyclaceae bacterium]|nr:MAG: cytochrome C biogenesis protein CcmH [Betaproteobacteria bacterium CG2_30_68_42]PIV72471.1 MAG: cytochrome C biogenesis protein CcmH [Rhodocyclales bacterium CG17_big_fil_post_rev_8_21_14_2_50_68_7]PIX74324.1 MAG: cytochrome C biogenesis protein CcmH [Rhodocyclales bacterium CG_4_10_14_3_um_filter_68_10]PJA58305.1 MAG: cytochrome C biogenesis protein CcmH [Rhodocyclales bacterium CG_4_9_14_3_um_filter_68_10]HCX34261.1 cytochrome C biogenesis protein CcmH [Rhodocyclaceae bacterium]
MRNPRTFLLALLVAAHWAAAAPAWAQEAAPAAEDPVLEKRMMKIAEVLRCLVCQNQTIADSRADLALDLRQQVREQLKAGRSEQQIIDYMVARYGDFVLYNPPVKSTTWLLWFGPFALLGVGLGVLYIKLRNRGRRTDASLTEAERARAESLLAGDERRDEA